MLLNTYCINNLPCSVHVETMHTRTHIHVDVQSTITVVAAVHTDAIPTVVPRQHPEGNSKHQTRISIVVTF